MNKTLKGAILLALAGMVVNDVRAATLTGVDVGSPSNLGSVTVANGVYTIVGGGSDIWGNSDNCYYAYFKQTGDFDYVAKVESLTGNTGDGGWSKVELMARLDDGSGAPALDDPFVANMTTRPSSDTPTTGSAATGAAGVNWRNTQVRTVRNAACDQETPSAHPNMPNNWVRLERVGSVFYLYWSDDGKTWAMYPQHSPQGWDTAGSWPNGADAATTFAEAWKSDVLLGLAVTAHSDADTSKAVVSNFGPYTPTPVAITTQPPATLAVSANNKLELSVTATGDPVHYEWRKNGTPIARSVGPTYTVSLAKISDSGTYTVRVFGGGKEITSQNSVVSVTQDTTPPTIAKVTADASFTAVVVTFSEPVTDTALAKANYSIDQGITVSSVARVAADAVSLTVSKMAEGGSYILTVNGVQDTATPANTIAANTKVSFKSFVFATGFAIYERWDGDTKAIADFATAILDGTQGPPTVVSAVATFQCPWGVADNYNARVSGYFVPPTTGSYVFFTDSDDYSNLYLSTDETPANKKMIAQETQWSNQYQFTASGGNSDLTMKRSDQNGSTEWPGANTIQLTGGKRYYMEALMHEGGGGDGCTITFIKEGDADPSNDVAGMHMLGSVIGTYFDPAGASITIGTQPASTSAQDGRKATFTIVATGVSAAGSTVSYQWQKAAKGSSTFADIVGATGVSYQTPVLALADDGTQYRVVCMVPALNQNSAVATLNVVPDTFAPIVLGASAFPSTTKVGVAFDEDLDATSVVAGAFKVNGAAVSSVRIRTNVANEKSNEKNLAELTVATALTADFTVTVTGVKDLKGNAMAATDVAGKLIKLAPKDIGSPAGEVGGPDPLFTGVAVNWGPGNFDVNCGGADYYNNADGFHFIWEKKTNSFDVKVRCVSIQPVNQWSAVGLMMRESLSELSREYHNKVVTRGDETTYDAGANGSNDYELNGRLATGDPTLREPDNTGTGGSVGWGGTAGGSAGAPNYPTAWVRIAREKTATSDHLKGYGSGDGEAWVLLQDVDLLDTAHAGVLNIDGTTPAGPWPDVCYVGMCTTAHNNSLNAGPDSFPNNPVGTAWNVWGVYREYGDMASAPATAPTLTFTVTSGNLKISWTGPGTLQSKTDLGATSWTDVGTANPATVPIGATGNLFLRVKAQ